MITSCWWIWFHIKNHWKHTETEIYNSDSTWPWCVSKTTKKTELLTSEAVALRSLHEDSKTIMWWAPQLRSSMLEFVERLHVFCLRSLLFVVFVRCFFWWLINKWLVTLRRSYDFGMFLQHDKPPRQGIALACFSRCVVSLSPAVLISVGLFWGTNIQTIKFGGQSLHPPQEAGDAASLILSGSKGGHEEFRDWFLQKMKISTS